MLTEKVKAVECASLVHDRAAKEEDRRIAEFFKKISQAMSVGTYGEITLVERNKVRSM